jgi:hypothetical protein
VNHTFLCCYWNLSYHQGRHKQTRNCRPWRREIRPLPQLPKYSWTFFLKLRSNSAHFIPEKARDNTIDKIGADYDIQRRASNRTERSSPKLKLSLIHRYLTKEMWKPKACCGYNISGATQASNPLYEGESVNRPQMDIRTWKKHLFFGISSTNTDTLVPSLYQCVETRSVEIFWLLSQPLPHLRFNLFVISEIFATFFDPVVTNATNTSHRKQETFLY